LVAVTRRDGRPVRVTDGLALKPGEVLTFYAAAPDGGTSLIVSQSAQGTLVPCVGGADEATVPYPGDRPPRLQGTWRVPNSPGMARIYLLWSPQNLRVEQVADAVQAARSSWRDPTLPVDASQSSLVVEIR
jgi:hypothetical protein